MNKKEVKEIQKIFAKKGIHRMTNNKEIEVFISFQIGSKEWELFRKFYIEGNVIFQKERRNKK